MKKIERIAASLHRQEKLLACPICGSRMHLAQGEPPRSLLCERRHCFDLSAKGYVTLLRSGGSGANGELYDRELFAARRSVFASGAYAPVADALSRILQEQFPAGVRSILDAGCGEGYYLQYLAGRLPGAPRLAGIDLSREGIIAAASDTTDAVWCVADLANLPFRAQSFDAVLNILTPARYGEFQRVLKPGGVLLKVIPSGDYLREIRERLPEPVGGDRYSDEEVRRYAGEHMRLEGEERIRSVSPLTPELWRDFIRMTPLTAHLTAAQKEELIAHPAAEITIELTVLICRATEMTAE